MTVASLPVRSREDLKKIGQCKTDLVELRLDYLESLDSFSLDTVEKYRSRLILTIREPDEGGVNSFGDQGKLYFIREAVKKGFLMDVEGNFAEKQGLDCTGQIVSRHYLESPPGYQDMVEFVERYAGISAISKLAVMEGKNTRISLVRLLGKYKGIAVMEMDGERSSRLLFSVLGSKLLYCHAGEKTSPGQLGCEEAVEILRLLKSRP